MGHNGAVALRFTLSAYSQIIRNEEEDHARYRALMHQLPRRFHRLDRALQAEALLEAPPLTGLRWDALLAAVVEHLARLHGHPVPEWVDEPDRFLDRPWMISRNPAIAADSLLYAPAAFIRHSALPDPSDLDVRGGEKHEWIPA